MSLVDFGQHLLITFRPHLDFFIFLLSLLLEVRLENLRYLFVTYIVVVEDRLWQLLRFLSCLPLDLYFYAWL